MKDDPVEVRAVLIVEEGEDDARLMIEALRRDGLEPSWRRVDTLSSLGTALESQEWDVVLSSRNLPGFDAWETLRQVRESSTDAPFILVSDAIGEEEAVAFVKAGAADFLLQSDLSRLPSAVVRAIAETKSRRRQREFEEHLRASESWYRALVESLPDLVFVLTADGFFVDYHAPDPKWLPAPPDGIIGRPLNEVFPPHVVRQVEPALCDVVRDGRFRQVTYPLDLPSGRRYFDSRLTRMEDGRILSVVRDVTRMKEAEQRLHDILEHSTNLFYSYAPDHLLDYVSPQSLHFLGCEAEKALAPLTDYFSDDPVNEAGLELSNRAIETGQSQPAYALELATRDGRKLWVEVNEAPIVRDGRTISMVGSLTDVTARKKAESERADAERALRLAQRMESIGRLAGGVAHDFNNLLSVILGYTSFAMENGRPGEPLFDDLDEIRKAGERATDLTRQLLAFSRRQVLRPSVLDLNEVVAKTEKLLRRVLGEDIELVTRLSQDLYVVFADKGQIEQILMNLAVNGRDAMSDGGRLVVETANAEVDRSYAESRPPMVSGTYVLLRVSDTGRGMPKAVLDKVFEPFFTTKEQGKGTGLGLSTVYGIVKQSNGFIWIDSEPDNGTAFSIYLPPCRQEASPSLVTPGDKPEAVGSKTVLVVEDERAVRLLAQRILEKAGYDVIATKDGQEALARCEQVEGPIHLLLTDVVMPKTNGRELAERISTIRPQIKVLFMSGYSEEMIAHHGVLEPGTDLIAKPFGPEELTRKVREVLGAV